MKIALLRVDNIGNHQIPIFAIGESNTAILNNNYTQVKWSNTQYPPSVGDRVNVVMNGFGFGTVIDYFALEGWLGIKVSVDKQPDWHKKQGGTNPISVFGAEVKY
jgi:hypothetical protein